MLEKEEERISKIISYALRHKPEEFGLVLRQQGFTDLELLIHSVNQKEGLTLTEEWVLSILDRSAKKRWEIQGKEIRAIYGHSTAEKIRKTPSNPPEYLYHGTSQRFLAKILKAGLLPKERQYVHLSQNQETALEVGKRRDETPILFEVSAGKAAESGILFYQEQDGIWLADSIPAEYLNVMNSKEEG